MGGRDSDWSLLNPNEGGSGARPQAGSGHPSALQRLLPAPQDHLVGFWDTVGKGISEEGPGCASLAGQRANWALRTFFLTEGKSGGQGCQGYHRVGYLQVRLGSPLPMLRIYCD